MTIANILKQVMALKLESNENGVVQGTGPASHGKLSRWTGSYVSRPDGETTLTLQQDAVAGSDTTPVGLTRVEITRDPASTSVESTMNGISARWDSLPKVRDDEPGDLFPSLAHLFRHLAGHLVPSF